MRLRERPPLVPRANRWAVGGFLVAAAIGLVHGDAVWLAVLVVVLIALRLLLWVAAPYNRFARAAIEERALDSETVVKPYRQIPIIGWLIRLGARIAGVPRGNRTESDTSK